MFVRYPHAALTQAASPRPVDDAMRAVGVRLLEAGKGVGAYGLAAAHFGMVEPVVLISVGRADQARDYRVLFNPVIVEQSATLAVGAEGSVSLPGIEVQVERATAVVVRFDDADGGAQMLALEGFAARVAQHEIDQMLGIFFLEQISRLKREAALRRFAKLARQP